MTSQETLGVQFLAWLERQGEAANSARLCQQALYLTRQVTAQDAEQRCGAGEEAGPQTENHTMRAKKGKQQGQGVAGETFAAAGRPPSNQISRAPTRGGPGQQYGSRSPDHIPRQEWAQKLLTEEGSKEIRRTAEARTAPVPCAEACTSTTGGCPGASSHGLAAGCRTAASSEP